MGKFIKEMVCLLVLFVLSMSVSVKSFADESIQLDNLDKNEPGYKEISLLEAEIMETLEDYLDELEKPALTESFTIDYSSAYKIYVDTDILELNTTDKNKILRELEKSEYMWLLPLYYNGDTFLVHISKGLPVDEETREVLSDEETKELEDSVGKWQVAAMELVEDETIDYGETIADVMESLTETPKNVETVLCGGLDCIIQPAAIVLDDEDSLFIPLSDLNIEGTEEQIQEIQPDGADIDDPVYYYEDIKEAISEMDTETMEGSGAGGGFIVLKEKKKTDEVTVCLIIGILSCAVMLVGYSILEKRRVGV